MFVGFVKQANAAYGDLCFTDSDCLRADNTLCIIIPVCVQGVCTKCRPNSVFSVIGGWPACRKIEGESCINNEECATGTCAGSICACAAGLTWFTTYQACFPDLQRVLGEPCDAERDCFLNAVDNGACINSVCDCAAGYYKGEGHVCRQPYLGETCDITVGCAIRGVLGEVAPVCINGLCVCDEAARQISATYDDKDYCTDAPPVILLKTSLGCTAHNQCESGRCVNCAGSPGTECIDVPLRLGENCTSRESCSDPNAGCFNGVCECSPTYYEHTTLASCQPMTQLRVTDIVFNDIKTDSFRVHWTPPTDLDNYVTGYTVSVLPNSPQPSIDVGNATYADITDLTPGKKYTVIIISRHGISAKTTRTTNTDKEQLTKPSVPVLNISKSNLDAADGSILLVWSIGSGVAGSYNVKLMDKGSVIVNQSVSSSFIIIEFPYLKNGYIYTVNIKAKTEEYGCGQTEDSETYSAIIKTKIRAPTAPVNARCGTKSQTDIYLIWDEPLFANGDLKQYRINVRVRYRSSVEENVETEFPVTETVVTGLQTDTEYEFDIFAENEEYLSSGFSSTVCMTLGKVADAAVDNASHNTVTIVLANCLSVLAVGFFIIVGYMLWKKRISKSKPVPNLYGVPLQEIKAEASAKGHDEKDTLKLELQSVSVSSQKLGSGQLGVVWKGSFQKNNIRQIVAVRDFKDDNTVYSTSDLQRKLENLRITGNHPNVAKLHGYSQYNDGLYIVMEYMSEGDLRSYLQKCRKYLQQKTGSKEEQYALTQVKLLQWALDIVNGMFHLHSKDIIHGDLAAKHVLFDSEMCAKVSDYGLTRTEEDYLKSSKSMSNTNKWMAIESLLYQKFNRKSDVWTFGVVLWEMTTLGGIPFPEIRDSDITELLKKGERLPKPENCSPELYDVIWRCWQEGPSHRPSYEKLIKEFQTMLDHCKVYMNLEFENEEKSVYESITSQ